MKEAIGAIRKRKIQEYMKEKEVYWKVHDQSEKKYRKRRPRWVKTPFSVNQTIEALRREISTNNDPSEKEP